MWLGLDVGTTSSKAVIYDDEGRVLAQGRTPTVWRSGPDGVDLDPTALLERAVGAVRAAVDRVPAGTRVTGVGITSMGETGVLVDRQGRPLAPAIAWHDERDTVEVSELAAEIGDAAFGSRAGKPLRGQFSLTKHRWLQRHEPATSSAVRRFNVAEWVARGLGAEEACDRVLACRTGWYDVVADRWWDEALAWSGASPALMPPLVTPGTAIGRVARDDAPPALRGAVVTLAGHDHQAAALGAGAVGPGDELDSSGTAEALVRTVPAGLPPGSVLALARGGITTDVSIASGRWSLLGGTEGGLAMQRTLEQLGVGRDGLAALDDAALAGTPGAGARWRAAVEAATGDAVRLHEAMTAVTGPHARIVVVGGWSNSAMVLQAKRDGFGPLTVSPVAEAGALGAATLAARAAGALSPDDVLGSGAQRMPRSR